MPQSTELSSLPHFRQRIRLAKKRSSRPVVQVDALLAEALIRVMDEARAIANGDPDETYPSLHAALRKLDEANR